MPFAYFLWYFTVSATFFCHRNSEIFDLEKGSILRKKIAIKMVIQDCKKIVLLTVLYLTFNFSDTKVFSLFVIIANVWHIWGFNPCKKNNLVL